MLNLVQTEFLKLRRKKMIWFMLLAAFIMPFFSFVYYNYFEASGIDPVAFYRLSAFGYTPFIILPFVLGVFCTVLKYSLQGTTQGRYLTGGVPPIRFSM